MIDTSRAAALVDELASVQQELEERIDRRAVIVRELMALIDPAEVGSAAGPREAGGSAPASPIQSGEGSSPSPVHPDLRVVRGSRPGLGE